MRRRKLATRFLGTLAGLAGAMALNTEVNAACCLDACPNPAIIACTSQGCPTDVVPHCPGQIVAESPSPTGTCGTGSFTDCPPTEVGHCTDGVNNDAWKDDLTDCADPDCFNDPACCGDVGQPCCNIGAPCVAPLPAMCDPGRVCDPGSLTCVACGAGGQPCCLADIASAPGSQLALAACAPGFLCRGETLTQNGTCVATVAPALSHIGLVAAGLLLLGGGAWFTRRRIRP